MKKKKISDILRSMNKQNHRHRKLTRTNYPREKVPHRVWTISWGYRDMDPRVTMLFPGDWTRDDVIKRADMLITQWVDEENDYNSDAEVEFDAGDELAIYGPFSESYIKIVKDLRPRERKEIENDLSFNGEAYLPRE